MVCQEVLVIVSIGTGRLELNQLAWVFVHGLEADGECRRARESRQILVETAYLLLGHHLKEGRIILILSTLTIRIGREPGFQHSSLDH